MMERMREPREILGGLGCFEWRCQEERRIAEAGTVEVFEEVRVRTTGGGFDVFVTVDAPVITRELVTAFVRDVQANGLVASRGTKAFCYGFDAAWHSEHHSIVPHCGA